MNTAPPSQAQPLNSLSLIIPVYNEAGRVQALLEALARVAWPSSLQHIEYLLVDDGSTDETPAILEGWCREHPEYRLLRQKGNRGKGAAIHLGLREAVGQAVGIQDADMELLPSDWPSMLQALALPGIGMVNGSRYLPGLYRPLHSYRRYIANKLFSWLTSLLIDIRITDMACGHKLLRRDLMLSLDLREERFGVESEILIKSARIRRNHIVEIPVHYFARHQGEGKKFRTVDGLGILWKIIRYSLAPLPPSALRYRNQGS